MTAARVQDAAAGANSTSVTVSLGGTPATGNLLVAWANSDALVSIGGTGWNAGPSVIDGNGTYIWWKTAGASEPSSVVFTPSVSDFISAGVAEYTGITASPLDVSGSSTHSGTAVSSTTAVSVTTTADHDLGFAVACLHAGPQAAPTSPTWTNSWTPLHEAGAAGPTYVVYTFAADNTDLGTAGSVSTAASWSGTTWPDAQQLLITFTASSHASIPVDAALAEASSAAAEIGRSAPTASELAQASTAAAAVGRTAPVDAEPVQPSTIAAAVGRTVPLGAALTQGSALTAGVVDRLTRRPNTGITARSFTGVTTRP